MAPFRYSTKKPEPIREPIDPINGEESKLNPITAEGGGATTAGALQENATLHEFNDRIKRRTARKAKSKALQKNRLLLFILSYCSDHADPGHLQHLERNIEDFERFYKESQTEIYDLSKKKEDELQQLLKIVQSIRFIWQQICLPYLGHGGMDQVVDYVTITPQAATMLGYDTLGPIRDWNQAKYLSDMQGGVSHLAVYLGGGIIE